MVIHMIATVLSEHRRDSRDGPERARGIQRLACQIHAIGVALQALLHRLSARIVTDKIGCRHPASVAAWSEGGHGRHAHPR